MKRKFNSVVIFVRPAMGEYIYKNGVREKTFYDNIDFYVAILERKDVRE